MTGEDILNVLQDVEWVVGSFVADATGQLVLYQMPPEFGQAELERTMSRLASIVQCAELCELGVEQCDFSLNRYQLHMTRFRGGFLCVMVEAPVNRRALEMATRIAVTQLPALLDSLGLGEAAGGEEEEEVTSRHDQPQDLVTPEAREPLPAGAAPRNGKLEN